MKRKDLVRGLAVGLSLSLVAGVALHYNNSSNADEVKEAAKEKVGTENQELVDIIDSLQEAGTKNGVTTYTMESDGTVFTFELSGQGENRKVVQKTSASNDYVVMDKKGDKAVVSQGKLVNNEFVETSAVEVVTAEDTGATEEEATAAIEEGKKKISDTIKKQYRPQYSYKDKESTIDIKSKVDKSKYTLQKSAIDEAGEKAYYEYVEDVNKFRRMFWENASSAASYFLLAAKNTCINITTVSTAASVVIATTGGFAPVAAAVAAALVVVVLVGGVTNGTLAAIKALVMKFFVRSNLVEMDGLNNSLAENYAILASYGEKIK